MKKIFIIVLIVSIGDGIKAQDVHFSNLKLNNFYTSIASIGSGNAKFSGASHYRNQWPTIGKSYQTIGINADYKLELDENSFGFGLVTSRDQAGELSLTRLQADAVVAYHQKISDASYFSGGLQLGVTQHSIDESKGEWKNQYDGKKFDPTLPSREGPLFQPFMNFDMGAGIMWNYDNRENNRYDMSLIELNFGLSVYHAIASKLDYNGNEPEYPRFSLTGSSVIVLSYQTYELEPAFLYQKKGEEIEFVFGTLYKFIVREESRYTGYYDKLDFSVGAYYRLPNDALIPTFNMNYDAFQFGVSYDVNTSKLVQASNTVGGIEFTVRYLLR